jgi:hypothetical protein
MTHSSHHPMLEVRAAIFARLPLQSGKRVIVGCGTRRSSDSSAAAGGYSGPSAFCGLLWRFASFSIVARRIDFLEAQA